MVLTITGLFEVSEPFFFTLINQILIFRLNSGVRVDVNNLTFILKFRNVQSYTKKNALSLCSRPWFLQTPLLLNKHDYEH